VTPEKERLVAVYDLGGGTFDISILEVADERRRGRVDQRDTHLGGDDFDNRVIDWLLAEFKKDSGIDVSRDKLVMQRLKDAAEKAKIELSQQPETEINLPFLTADATGPKHLQIRLSRAKLEALIEDLVDRNSAPRARRPCATREDGRGDRRGAARRRLDPGSRWSRRRSRSSSARTRTEASMPTRSWRSALRCRPAC
jgi:molecular chaperone DnaK